MSFKGKTLIGLAFFSISSWAYAGPSGVKIDSISHGGTGCPQGTVGQTIASDAESFTLLFDEYIAETGPFVSRRDSRKFCQITLDLKVPQGWSYAIADFDYRGWASLDYGVYATQSARYYFDRNREGSFQTTIRGSFDDDYLMSDSIDFDSLVWSPCGEHRLLNIKTQISLRSRDRNAEGIITVDSLDGKVRQIYGLQWRRCGGRF